MGHSILGPQVRLHLPLYLLDGASFRSVDSTGHLCTSSGSVWRPKGRYFDGVDDFLSLTHHARLLPGGAFSVVAWIKPNKITGTQQIFNKLNAGDFDDRTFSFYINTDDIIFRIWGNVTSNSIGRQASNKIVADKWTHVAGVYRGGVVSASVEVFVDGVRSDDANVQNGTFTAIGTSTKTPFIGKEDGDVNYFSGLIGEVLMLIDIISPQQILAHYLGTKARYG